MVDLEDAQPVPQRTPIRERVEAGAEHDELLGAARECVCERVLCEARACDDEEAHPAPLRVRARVVRDGIRVVAQDPQSERDRRRWRLLQDLMRGAVRSRAARRSARLAVLHPSSIRRRMQARNVSSLSAVFARAGRHGLVSGGARVKDLRGMSLHEIVLPETKPETEWVRGRALQKVSPRYRHARCQSVS